MQVISDENRKSLKYVGCIYIAVLFIRKVPHDSYSFAEYVIRPIHIGEITVYLSGIVSLVLFIVGFLGLCKIKKFYGIRKLGVLLLIFAVFIPFINWTIDSMRSNYHWVFKDGLNSVEITESEVSLITDKDGRKLDFELELIDYNRSGNEFKIRVYLSKSLYEAIGQEYIDFNGVFHTSGNRNKIKVGEIVNVNYKIPGDYNDNSFIYQSLYYEDLTYELYNESNSIKILRRGLD
jgi:hypothetical protein